jgi:hypothetical protein
MRTTTKQTSLLLLISVCLACGASFISAAQTPATGAGDLKYKVPDGWVIEHPTSNMRVGQYALPKAAGDGEDGSMVLYYFGNQGGTVQANIDRWIEQMEQPDKSSSKDKAKAETLTVNGMKVTMVDVSGTYIAQMSPGSEARHNNPNYRLRAAVVETPKGNYFAKLIGPAKTIGRWNESFVDYVKSFEFK